MESTRLYEEARHTVARFLKAPSEASIVFTMGYGGDLQQLTRSAVQVGEADRREEQAIAAAAGPAALDATTDCAGHA